MMGYYYGYNSFWPFHFLGALLWIVAIILILRFLFWGIRGGRHSYWHGMRDWRGDSALDLLKERYVKGEISKEEYEEKYKVISGESANQPNTTKK